jgi:hypothetical protein
MKFKAAYPGARDSKELREEVPRKLSAREPDFWHRNCSRTANALFALVLRPRVNLAPRLYIELCSSTAIREIRRTDGRARASLVVVASDDCSMMQELRAESIGWRVGVLNGPAIGP